ncbi:acyl-CoA reductase [Streptomyces mirabilis]|uniref:acyl-CoA reductase n=1 Tax=Streptomyces mirabilis TaxID=68239 RepID=UPI0006CDA01B|nr:acyl-CoA reductase [Actinobacteria bacterium OK006]
MGQGACRAEPDTRQAEPCDALACAGVQRVVSLGRADGAPPGLSRDGFHPLRRLMRRVDEECIGLRSAVGTRVPMACSGPGKPIPTLPLRQTPLTACVLIRDV